MWICVSPSSQLFWPLCLEVGLLVLWEEEHTYYIGNFQALLQLVVWVPLHFPSLEIGPICNCFLGRALGCGQHMVAGQVTTRDSPAGSLLGSGPPSPHLL